MRVRQAQRTVSSSHLSAGRPWSTMPNALGDRLLVGRSAARLGAGFEALVGRVEGEVEDLLLLGAEHREHAVRLELAERLGEVEVVAVLLAVLLLARRGPWRPGCPGTTCARGALPIRSASSAKRSTRIARAPSRAAADVRDVLVQVAFGGRARVRGRVAEQQVRERLEAVLAGDLRLGAPLRLVRQVEVFQPGLGVGRVDLAAQLVGELALLVDRGQDRGAALLELAQVAQPLLQGPQLRVVQGAGGLLAVPGDERHGRPAVEQVNGGGDLAVAHGELGGDPLDDAGAVAAWLRGPTLGSARWPARLAGWSRSSRAFLACEVPPGEPSGPR